MHPADDDNYYTPRDSTTTVWKIVAAHVLDESWSGGDGDGDGAAAVEGFGLWLRWISSLGFLKR
jgi:hypothetical protein